MTFCRVVLYLALRQTELPFAWDTWSKPIVYGLVTLNRKRLFISIFAEIGHFGR